MTNRASAVQKIAAVLDYNSIPHTPCASGMSIRFSSALLEISVSTLGMQVLVGLRCAVLRGVSPEHEDELLKTLNQLNCDSHFGKWIWIASDQVVGLEYDLLGDNLQEAELMTSIATLARLADQQDNLLQEKYGGQVAHE